MCKNAGHFDARATKPETLVRLCSRRSPVSVKMEVADNPALAGRPIGLLKPKLSDSF